MRVCNRLIEMSIIDQIDLITLSKPLLVKGTEINTQLYKFLQWIVDHGLVPRSAAGCALANGIVDQSRLPLAVGVVLPVVGLLRRRIGNLRFKFVKFCSEA